MTPDEYRAAVRSLGLTPARPSYEGATLHQDRDGLFWNVTNPETLTMEERIVAFDFLRFKMDLD